MLLRNVMDAPLSNHAIAAILDGVGDRLADQRAHRFRVEAYHRAAASLRSLEPSVTELALSGGRGALESLPCIGSKLASAIDEIAHTGSLRLLERLRGKSAPEDLFASIPGIGEELAHRIHEHLNVDSLEALEVAAHDGRLAAVPGFGADRTRLICAFLEATLGRSSRRRARGRHAIRAESSPRPGVGLLLEIDRHYRELAEHGALPRIAPHRFNPDGERWLPIWHPNADGWHFTVLYSNSALAHKLGKTHDWVVIYFERDGDEDQCTVVTEHRGSLRDQRVVRGREQDCRGHYDACVARDEIREWAHAELEKLNKPADKHDLTG